MVNERQIAIIEPAQMMPLSETLTIGETLARSGYFKDATDKAQAVAKILYGQELGVGPVSSMQGIYMVEGKLTLAADLMATLIQKHPRWDYIVNSIDKEGVSISFLRDGKVRGTSTFTTDDAIDAGLMGGKRENWNRYPRNMMWARAMSNGAKWFCPEVFGGAPVYTPEELGAETDQDGIPIGAPAIERRTEVSEVKAERPTAIEGEIVEKPAESESDKRDRNAFWARATELGLKDNRAELAKILSAKAGESLADWVKQPGHSWQAAQSKINLWAQNRHQPESPKAPSVEEPMPEAPATGADGSDSSADGGFLGLCEVCKRNPADGFTNSNQVACQGCIDRERAGQAPVEAIIPLPIGVDTASGFLTAAEVAFKLDHKQVDQLLGGATWRRNMEDLDVHWAALQVALQSAAVA